ncbi:MAG: 3-dehydroquinate synthase [Thermoproteus sp.]|nr:3-dehydroquinate synthase [Thermoproteus sp.]
MKRFVYVHSRGATEVVVGVDVDLAQLVERPVIVAEEGLKIPIDAPALRLRGGEQIKDISTLYTIYRFFMEHEVDRGSDVVAVGGGALLDVTTFAAGTYMRGVGLVNVPTTLLAMVDAAIGGKGAVDWGDVKNLVGVFYQPRLVICDLRWTHGLPERVYRAAFAEVVKYGVSLDPPLLDFLSKNAEALLARDPKALEGLVYKAARDKASVVELDEFEAHGIREVLNVGHTIGHALERTMGLLHGEAVSIGLVAELKISSMLGYTSDEQVEQARQALEGLGLPTRPPRGEGLGEALKLIKYDKKRRGDKIRVPLVVGLGKWILEEFELERFIELAEHVLR